VVTDAEAREVAERYLAERHPKLDPVVVDDGTREEPFGWVFFWTGRAHGRTGDPRRALAGNGPLVVTRDGAVHETGTAFPLEAYLRRFREDGVARCGTCGAPVEVHVGQTLADAQLRWHRSYACGACGARVEEDDVGPAPEEVRRAVLACGGVWRLLLDATGARAARALKVLRAALGLSVADAAALRRCIPGAVATGTRAEMEQLRRELEADGVPATVDRAGPDPPDADSQAGRRGRG
jgi:hypothetical protein